MEIMNEWIMTGNYVIIYSLKAKINNTLQWYLEGSRTLNSFLVQWEVWPCTILQKWTPRCWSKKVYVSTGKACRAPEGFRSSAKQSLLQNWSLHLQKKILPNPIFVMLWFHLCESIDYILVQKLTGQISHSVFHIIHWFGRGIWNSDPWIHNCNKIYKLNKDIHWKQSKTTLLYCL